MMTAPLNDDTMQLTNDLFDHEHASQAVRARLESASPAVAARYLRLSGPLSLTAGIPTAPWLLEILMGGQGDGRGVVFIDTAARVSSVEGDAAVYGSSNPHEAAAAACVVDALLQHDLAPADVAVVSPFKVPAPTCACVRAHACVCERALLYVSMRAPPPACVHMHTRIL